MNPTPLARLKCAFVQELLANGVAMLLVDARREGVEVPEALRDQGKLVLRLGYRLTPPIPDIEVDDEAVTATLTFGPLLYHCVVPWSAVISAFDSLGQIGFCWPEEGVLRTSEPKVPDQMSKPKFKLRSV